MIDIVTESIACLNEEDCAAYGVKIVALSNVSDGNKFSDVIGEFKVSDDSFTLPPSEYAYYRAFYESVHAGNRVLCITLSRKLSQAYANACESAEKFEKGQVVVIDSMSCAGGQLLMIMKAREMEASGMSFENIVKTIESYKKSLALSFIVNDIRSIMRSKRISKFARVGSPILSQKPLFVLTNGGVNYVSGGNTMFGCIKKMISYLGNPSKMVINYSSSLADEKELAETVRKKFPEAKVYIRRVSASLLINIGEVICVVGDGASVRPNQK